MKISAINNLRTNIINPSTRVQRQNTQNIQTHDVFKKNTTNPYPHAIAFQGVLTNGVIRQRGLYHHISALPAKGSFC